jgi:hypothetical protein
MHEEHGLLTTTELNTLYKSLVLLSHIIMTINETNEPSRHITDTMRSIEHLISQERNHKEHQKLMGNLLE